MVSARQTSFATSLWTPSAAPSRPSGRRRSLWLATETPSGALHCWPLQLHDKPIPSSAQVMPKGTHSSRITHGTLDPCGPSGEIVACAPRRSRSCEGLAGLSRRPAGWRCLSCTSPSPACLVASCPGLQRCSRSCGDSARQAATANSLVSAFRSDHCGRCVSREQPCRAPHMQWSTYCLQDTCSLLNPACLTYDASIAAPRAQASRLSARGYDQPSQGGISSQLWATWQQLRPVACLSGTSLLRSTSAQAHCSYGRTHPSSTKLSMRVSYICSTSSGNARVLARLAISPSSSSPSPSPRPPSQIQTR